MQVAVHIVTIPKDYFSFLETKLSGLTILIIKNCLTVVHNRYTKR